MAMRIRTDDPRNAVLLDDATGAVVGLAGLCDACGEFIDSVSDAARNGACASVNPYTWRCKKCIVEHRATGARGPQRIEIAIPERYADASIMELPPQKRAIAKLWPSKMPFMIVSGIPGAGKSRLTWAYVKAGAQARKGVMRLNSLEIQREWAGKIHHEQRVSMQRVWESERYLILDDLSACDGSNAWTRVIHQLLDARLVAERATLITTAAGPESLREIYMDAIHSRLLEFEWLYLPSVDHRARRNSELAANETETSA